MIDRLQAFLPAQAHAVAILTLPKFCRLFYVAVALAATVTFGEESADPFTAEVAPFLAKYCFDCHEGDASEAGVDLSRPTTHAEAQQRSALWNQIRGLIELGAMPPADHDPLPTKEEREAMAARIDELINRVDCQQSHAPDPVTMRRLNAVEYDNTVCDLMRIDIRPSQFVGLPSDDVGNGFDNQGEVLSASPLLLEKYLQAAQEITDRAILFDRETHRQQTVQGEDLFVGQECRRTFRLVDGEYRIRIGIEFGDGKTDHKVPAVVLLDGKEIHTAQVGRGWRRLKYKVDVTAGEHELTVRFDSDPLGEGTRSLDRRLQVFDMSFEGPPVPPRSHTALFVAEPSDDLSPSDAARIIFDRFLPRAYRRPVEPLEVERIVTLAATALEQGQSFEQAIALGVQAALVSPHFVFRVEPTPTGAAAELDGYQLANRLSYFLWASMPDEELFAAAASGSLVEANQLQQQVERMLAAPAADTLVTRFFAQWLGLTALESVSPDPETFPLWNSKLSAAVREETFRLCRTVINEDRSLLDLLDADFTFINPRLAELYGLSFLGQDPRELYFSGPGEPDAGRRRQRPTRGGDYLSEDQWVRVVLPEGRRGVMTHASVLALTSNPAETSPVKRGRWVLDVVLGAPPPPAPPSVPSLEETASGAEDRPLREQLALHRSNPSCAGCHAQMDPIGLGLQNFDAIGRWREEEEGEAIDASGELDGESFSGPLELLDMIRSNEKQIARNFVRRLMTYALGRGLRPADQCAVDEIVARAESSRFRVSDLITGVVLSDSFRLNGGTDHETDLETETGK